MRKLILAAATVLASTQALAQEKQLQTLPNAAAFVALGAAAMQPGQVYFQFTDAPASFTDWMASSPAEYAYLALWDGYTEPTLLTHKKKIPITEKMTMFVAKSKTIINKPSANINLKSLITVDFIKSLDAEILHGQINAAQVMPVVGGQPNITNFQALCNKEGTYITRPAKELSLDKINRPGQPWCADTARSVCVESCYIFNRGYRGFVTAYNNFKAEDEFDKKDFGMATQSEIRYFTSEAEMGKKVPVSVLSGINTPVRGVFEQNIFYFNQLVQYGKIVSFFQEHPTDASKTIVTSYLAFGIQSSTYAKSYNLMGMTFELKELLMGRGGRLNTETGITAGLPVYTKNIAKALATRLEAN